MAERTCLACRKAQNKSDLIRYVLAPDGQVTVDYRGRLPGRGAYTCFSLECLHQAAQKRQFDRAFKGKNVRPDGAMLQSQLQQAVQAKITSLLGMARKSGQIAAGTNEVQTALKKRPLPALILVATDLGAAIEEKVCPAAERLGVPVYKLFDKNRLGAVLGKGVRSAVAFPQGSLGAAIKDELERYRIVLGEH